MRRIEKTVFLSYRRTNFFGALAIFQHLTQHGYDVFMDYTGIASGDFESIILENVRTRAHFLVLLTPSALKRCGEPGDWLRREIETALDTKRNIVPLMLEGFDFGTPAIANQLTGKLAVLKQYNAMGVPAEYFDAAMEKLREKYLNVALDSVAHPASPTARQAASEQKAAAAAAPAVAEEELTAEGYFERAFNATDPDEKIRLYSQAIRLKPDYAAAFCNRGVARKAKGDLHGAMQDFEEAIRLKADFAEAFYNRGNARKARGDLEGALVDYDQAIRLQPDDPDVFYNRAIARSAKGALEGAIADYNQAIRLKPDFAAAFNNRGDARYKKGDLKGALQDFDEAICLKPDYANAFFNRAIACMAKGDLEGAAQDFNKAVELKPGFVEAVSSRDAVRKAIAEQSKR